MPVKPNGDFTTKKQNSQSALPAHLTDEISPRPMRRFSLNSIKSLSTRFTSKISKSLNADSISEDTPKAEEVMQNLQLYYKMLFDPNCEDKALVKELQNILDTVHMSLELKYQRFSPDNGPSQHLIPVIDLIEKLRARPSINKILETEHRSTLIGLYFSHLFFERIHDVEGMLALLKVKQLDSIIQILSSFQESELSEIKKNEEVTLGGKIFTSEKKKMRTLFPIELDPLRRLISRLGLTFVLHPDTQAYEVYGLKLCKIVYDVPSPVYIPVEYSLRGSIQLASDYFLNCKRTLETYESAIKWLKDLIDTPKNFEAALSGPVHQLPQMFQHSDLYSALDFYRNNKFGDCLGLLSGSADRELQTRNYLNLPKEGFIPAIIGFAKRFMRLIAKMKLKSNQEAQIQLESMLDKLLNDLHQAFNYPTRNEIIAIICEKSGLDENDKKKIEKIRKYIEADPGLPSKEKVNKFLENELCFPKEIRETICSFIRQKPDTTINWKKLEEFFTGLPSKYSAVIRSQEREREDASKVFFLLLERVRKCPEALNTIKEYLPALGSGVSEKSRALFADINSIFFGDLNIQLQQEIFKKVLGDDLRFPDLILIEFIVLMLSAIVDFPEKIQEDIQSYVEEVFPYGWENFSWKTIAKFLEASPDSAVRRVSSSSASTMEMLKLYKSRVGPMEFLTDMVDIDESIYSTIPSDIDMSVDIDATKH
jgi:hypothetical protein